MAATEDYQYDEKGRVISKTKAGIVTTYTYDVLGNLSSQTEAVGTSKQRTTTWLHEDPLRPTLVTKVITQTANGTRTVAEGWNANETVITSSETGKIAAGGATVTYTRTSTFDTRHRLLTEDGPRTDVADVTTYAYYSDDDPDLNRRGRLRRITNALGLTITFEDYDAFGTARRVIDTNGVITNRQTDARGRITTSTLAAVSGDPAEATDYTSQSTYDSRDRLIETRTPRGTRTRYTYEDGTNWLTSTVRLDLSGNEVERRLLTLNAAGLTVREDDESCTTPATTCASWVTKRTVSYTYDDKGRLTQMTHPVPSGARVIYGYDTDGRLASVQDENHSTPNTTYQYDELDRLTRVTQTLSTAPSGTAVTTYGYDPADNRTAVTDPNGNVTTYAYDDFQRMYQQSSPVTGTTTYAYDAAGNLTSTTDANGGTTVRAYDALSRVTSATASRTGAATESVTWTYDDPVVRYSRGRVTAVAEPTGTTTYAYDRRGLVTTERKTMDNVLYTTTYGYDADGNRTTIGYLGGRNVTYGFDFANRQQSVTAGTTQIVTSAAYVPFGPATQLVFGNGTTRTMQFDQRYRVLENKLAGSGGSTLAR